MKTKMIVVGLGHAWREHYSKVLHKVDELELIGTVDPAFTSTEVMQGGTHGHFHVQTVGEIPSDFVSAEVMVMVLTPDHYDVLAELAHMGFRNILCEKPLVSRVAEIPEVERLVASGVKLYAMDFYLPKTLGLQVVKGLVTEDDPRYPWLRISEQADFKGMLGEVEGVGVQIVEAGKFCLPDLAGRPYLATDKEIGGMILDLITHACGPLQQAGLLDDWRVLDASLARLNENTTGHLVPVRQVAEVEMYATALLEAGEIPVSLSFGKVPISKGGLWSLQVRGKNGVYYAGLRTGQPSVLIGNDGHVVTFSLTLSTYEFVLREALLYFHGMLSGFDGNLGAFKTSMEVGQAILGKYWERISK
ncbi:MAG: Gfo/Idh/MocA family oxidoreductase [bacterium]|nr:Gfo/Idh/MocA family oxidoreductase [bacterium]